MSKAGKRNIPYNSQVIACFRLLFADGHTVSNTPDLF
jgi:hypothetical protein